MVHNDLKRDPMEVIVEGIESSAAAGYRKACEGRAVLGVSLRALAKSMKEAENEFQAARGRVREKLASGARRTAHDPV